MSSPVENRILALWRRVASWPAGPRIFSVLLGRMVPYSGTIRPRVRELKPGRAVVELRDRRAVRQHLGSVHAVALANLGELTSGLAMTAAMPADVRGIVTRMEIEYFKKARGLLTATSESRFPDAVTEPIDHPVVADIHDAGGDLVSRVTAYWRLAPRPGSSASSTSAAAAS